MPNEHFCLKWNNFQRNIVAALGNLKLDEDFVDVTISCEGGKLIKAHKVILSACSDYFRDLFRVRHSLYIRFRRIFQLNLKPSQNKKGRKGFQLHRFLNTIRVPL